MPYCGYFYEPDEILDSCIDMPTSIVRIYTPEGFVVAADGREYDPKSKKVLSNSFRKIFTVEEAGRRLTYALSGTNKITLHDSTEIDMVPAIHAAVAALTDKKLRGLEDYAKALTEGLGDLPKRDKEKPTIVYLDGYYNGQADRVHIKIFHDEDKKPKSYLDSLDPGHTIGCGSNIIFDALRSNSDSRLAQYRSSAWDVRRDARTLQNAIDIAKSWMDAHCGPEALGIDPQNCVAIGGIAHMCIVRPNAEFKWMYRNKDLCKWVSCAAPTGTEIP